MFLVTLSMSTVFSRTAYIVKNIDLRRSQSMPNYAPPKKCHYICERNWPLCKHGSLGPVVSTPNEMCIGSANLLGLSR